MMNAIYEISIDNIVKKYDLELLVIFGSYGTDRYRKDSDIDIAYISKTNLSPKDDFALLNDLIRHFRKAEVDLVNFKKANVLLKYEIITKVTKVLYGNDEVLEHVKLYTIKRFQEMKPFLDKRVAFIREEVRNFRRKEDGC